MASEGNSLWAHQREAFERAKDANEFGLFFEVGTGKTRTAIEILRYKFSKHNQILKTLIFCPPIVIPNWKNEFIKYSKINPKRVILLQGSQIRRVQDFDKHADEGAIFVTNYESLNMVNLYGRFIRWKPHVVVWDELHKLKNITAKRTKQAINVADETIYRLGLTGTPVLNSPMDLFAQFRCLDKGDTFGRNFFAFRAKYFWDKNAGMPQGKYFPDWRPRNDCFPELNRRVAEKSLSVKKQDCLDLPPLLRKTIYVGMAKDQEKAYESMKKVFVAYINDKAAIADLAITKALRLQQIVSGFVKMDDESITRFSDNPRKEALHELLEELAPNHKVIVWAVFKENYRDIREVCEELKIKFVEVHGEVSAKEKHESVDAFNSDPSVRVLIGHPSSGGIGVNLVASDVAIFYSRNFSLEQDLQAEGRNYRGGSEVHKKVTRIDLVTAGTIDELVVERLAQKVNIGEKILREMVL